MSWEERTVYIDITDPHWSVIACKNGQFVGKVSRYIMVNYKQDRDCFHDREQAVCLYTKHFDTVAEAADAASALACLPVKLQLGQPPSRKDTP